MSDDDNDSIHVSDKSEHARSEQSTLETRPKNESESGIGIEEFEIDGAHQDTPKVEQNKDISIDDIEEPINESIENKEKSEIGIKNLATLEIVEWIAEKVVEKIKNMIDWIAEKIAEKLIQV